MKVIVAGMPKTGTKSLAKALEILGYEVYDFLEHFAFHGKQWKKIMLQGADCGDFKEMYKSVDAITDIPACFYWEKISKAFPDAKIVFMERKSEEDWFDSMQGQSDELNRVGVRFLPLFSPTARAIHKFSELMVLDVFGCVIQYNIFRVAKINELLYKRSYRQHNAYLKENAPKDKLLKFSVGEGWEPLCTFLNKEIPTEPFPHENARGTASSELFKRNSIYNKVIKEALVSVSLLVALISFCLYKLLF